VKIPSWIKRLLFGRKHTIDQVSKIMAEGGIAALSHRLDTMPPIAFFGVFDGDQVLVKAFHRTDVDPEVVGELGQHLAHCASEYLETCGRDEAS